MKRALVLSGGGAKAAFQAGVIRGLALAGQPGFDFVTGLSVGAINAAGLAQFDKADFVKASRWLETLWTQQKVSLCRLTRWSWLRGWKRAYLGHNSALQKLIATNIDLHRVKTSDVALLVHAVDLSSGDVRSFGDQSAYLNDGMMGCASLPVIHPPHKAGERSLCDGATVKMDPVGEAVDRGAEHITVVLDVDPMAPVKADVPQSAPAMLAHVLDLNARAALTQDLFRCQHINKHIGRYAQAGKHVVKLSVIMPEQPLGDSLDYSPARLRLLFEAGVKRGKADVAITVK